MEIQKYSKQGTDIMESDDSIYNDPFLYETIEIERSEFEEMNSSIMQRKLAFRSSTHHLIACAGYGDAGAPLLVYTYNSSKHGPQKALELPAEEAPPVEEDCRARSPEKIFILSTVTGVLFCLSIFLIW